MTYHVRCAYCNRIQKTSKDKFQCRKCGKRSPTEPSMLTEYEITHGVDTRLPNVLDDIEMIEGIIIE